MTGNHEAEPKNAREIRRKIRLPTAPANAAAAASLERTLRDVDGVLQDRR